MSGRPSQKSAEIGLFRPFSAFFALFWRAWRAPGKSRKRRKKAFFLRYPRISLNPPSLKPPFAAPQFKILIVASFVKSPTISRVALVRTGPQWAGPLGVAERKRWTFLGPEIGSRHCRDRSTIMLFEHKLIKKTLEGPRSFRWEFPTLGLPFVRDFHSCYRAPGPQKGFWRVSERVLVSVSRRPLPNPFKNPSKTLQEGVEINDALGFPGLKNQFQGPGVL